MTEYQGADEIDGIISTIEESFKLISIDGKTIRISDSLKIVVANLNEELKDKTIELKGSKLTLTIDSKYKEKVKSLIKSGRENV